MHSGPLQCALLAQVDHPKPLVTGLLQHVEQVQAAAQQAAFAVTGDARARLRGFPWFVRLVDVSRRASWSHRQEFSQAGTRSTTGFP